MSCDCYEYAVGIWDVDKNNLVVYRHVHQKEVDKKQTATKNSHNNNVNNNVKNWRSIVGPFVISVL